VDQGILVGSGLAQEAYDRFQTEIVGYDALTGALNCGARAIPAIARRVRSVG